MKDGKGRRDLYHQQGLSYSWITQQEEEEASIVTGYRIRITESEGTPMCMLLPSTNPWGPQDCTRKDCVTCNQNDEKRIDCKKRNILYESECVLCREVKKAGEGKEGQNM